MKQRVVIVAVALALLSGCQAGGVGQSAEAPQLRQVHASSQCNLPGEPAEAFLVGDAGRWAELARRLQGLEIGAPALPPVDFERERVLVVSMGQRTSGGYAVALAEGHRREGDALTVAVDWQEPAPGSMQTMALTQPCLVVAVPRAGFERVRVVDRNGRVRLEAGE